MTRRATTCTARSHPAVALTVVALLALAGCAGGDEPGGATPSASESASASASETPAAETPTAAASAEPAAPAGTTRITAPADGATLAGPNVEVTGEGTAFEGTLSWRVVTAGTDDMVAESFTTAGANGTIGPFTFTVDLAPGSYTLEVWEPDMSDGAEGTAQARATTTFTVT